MIYVGGYHEYHGGCSAPWGTQITKDFFPHGTERPSPPPSLILQKCVHESSLFVNVF